MQIKRTAALTAVACLALGGLAACGDGGSGGSGPGIGLTGGAGSAGRNNGVEKLTPGQIREKAQSALHAAKSVHVVTDSDEADIDMTIVHTGDCKGTYSQKGGRAHFVKTGDTAYLKGDRDFWALVSPDDADTIDSAAAGRYLKTAASDSSLEIDDLCDLGGTLTPDNDDDGSQDTLTKGGVSTVHGVRCVEVTAEDSDGTAHIYVATDGKPYPVTLTFDSGGDRLTGTLSDYDRQVSIQAPPDDQVVDGSQILK